MICVILFGVLSRGYFIFAYLCTVISIICIYDNIELLALCLCEIFNVFERSKIFSIQKVFQYTLCLLAKCMFFFQVTIILHL